MFSVTKRIETIQQPRNGYINPALFSEKQLNDNEIVCDVVPAAKSIQGLAVDYLTRFMSGCPKSKAFNISIKGADFVSESEKANLLLDKINGLDDESIVYACQLVGYDVAFRMSPQNYVPIKREIIDNNLVSNVRLMVKRSLNFFKQFGPITSIGFTMEDGYNEIVSSGDGDYLTNDTIWDCKVSSKPLNIRQTLQLAMYYIMGIHSVHSDFKQIKNLGIYNPLLNKAYLLKISSIDDSVFAAICRDVIGYNTPNNNSEWRLSYGTNLMMKTDILSQATSNAFKDTGFRPEKYEDGIYDITIDDYWSYFRDKSKHLFTKPKFIYTKAVKFLKCQGFYMFVSVSEKGSMCIMQGGKLRKIKKPLQYYYNHMAEYGNLILQYFSNYWDVLYSISKQIQQIEPDIETVRRHNYGEYKKSCQKYNWNCDDFETWYSHNKSRIKFDGKVHGCIIDLDYTNHIYINPYDGTIAPYSAWSKYEKYIYDNVASLISMQRPEMLAGFREIQQNASTSSPTLISSDKSEQYSLVSINNGIIEKVLEQGIAFENEETISDNIKLVTDTDMYYISDRLKILQLIYDYHLIAVWYDSILPHHELEGDYYSKKGSLLGQSAKMKCGMIATVVSDNGYKDISVRFEDGTIVEHVTRQQYRRRSIKNPNVPMASPQNKISQRNKISSSYFTRLDSKNAWRLW